MDFQLEIEELRGFFASPRFRGIQRVYSAREVVEQRGTIRPDYAVARVVRSFSAHYLSALGSAALLTVSAGVKVSTSAPFAGAESAGAEGAPSTRK